MQRDSTHSYPPTLRNDSMKVPRILPRIARACTVIFNPPSLYSSKQQMRRYCWERVREERTRLGFDRMEVARIEIM